MIFKFAGYFTALFLGTVLGVLSFLQGTLEHGLSNLPPQVTLYMLLAIVSQYLYAIVKELLKMWRGDQLKRAADQMEKVAIETAKQTVHLAHIDTTIAGQEQIHRETHSLLQLGVGRQKFYLDQLKELKTKRRRKG